MRQRTGRGRENDVLCGVRESREVGKGGHSAKSTISNISYHFSETETFLSSHEILYSLELF